MNGYSKMKIIDTTNSKSMEFSDLLSLSQTQNSTRKATKNPKARLQEPNDQIKNPPNKEPPTEELEEEVETEDHHHQECNVGDKFGGVNKLSRTSSVSSASSASAVHSALKRALSMTRSSSVSERYCRIHDQSATFSSPIDDEDGVEMGRTRSVMNKKHSKSKILKACKKLFGL